MKAKFVDNYLVFIEKYIFVGGIGNPVCIRTSLFQLIQAFFVAEIERPTDRATIKRFRQKKV
jgi:hypothetical protein